MTTLLRGVFPVLVSLGLLAGCATTAPEDEAASVGETSEAFTDSHTAVETPWGTEQYAARPEGQPKPSWPGVFDQPAMKSGPGSCGFAAVANLSTQMLSASGRPARPITPWDALEAQRYNTIIGLYPSDAIRLLNNWFASDELAGDLQGTRFEWGREGVGNHDQAWSRLRSSLEAGQPFIALVNYGQEGEPSWFNCTSNHYVTVVAVNADDSVVIGGIL